MAAKLENAPMTAEMQQLAADPNFIVEFAIGDPTPDLIPQTKGTGIVMSSVYFTKTKCYIMKSCHLSKDDVRILDVNTGKVVMVSHHPGKNPYEELDPLKLGNTGNQHAVQGGEWESACDVSARHPSMPSFRIRPKSVSRHGRQYVKKMRGKGDDAIIFNIGKKGKLSTKSLRPHFEVGRGPDGEDDYTIVADMMERTFAIENSKGEVVAQVAKTAKAMMQTAVLGGGAESTIDIAPGVDCSTILAMVFGLGQVGAHYAKDYANNYVVDPIRDSLLGSAADMVPGAGQAQQAYTDASNEAVKGSRKLTKVKKFFDDTFR